MRTTRSSAHGFPTPRMVMWSGSGKRLGEVANGLRLPDGTVSITVERGQLHGALRREALRPGIRIEEGRRLVSAAPAAPVRRRASRMEPKHMLTCSSAQTGSIANATTRPPGGAAAAIHRSAQRWWSGASPTLSPTPETFHMIFGRRAFFGYSGAHGETWYWFANVAWDGETTRESLAAVSPMQWKRQLLALVADDAGPARDIINATDRRFCRLPRA